jgi:co-chaperonin GroES (HSP10)
MMKKSESEEAKKVKIITPESAIELQKKSGKQEIVVKIDGQQVNDEERLQEHGIDKSDFQVFVQKRGVSVRFDGEEATIKGEFLAEFFNLIFSFQSAACTRTFNAVSFFLQFKI